MHMCLVLAEVKYMHQVRNKTVLDVGKDVQSSIDKKRYRYIAQFLCFRFLKYSCSNSFAEKLVKINLSC